MKFRTSADALSVNDTDFIHVDFNDAKRVVVWRRGQPGSDRQVVVVANFSDFMTANALSESAEYFVPNWPATPAGKRWREITQERDVPSETGRTRADLPVGGQGVRAGERVKRRTEQLE